MSKHITKADAVRSFKTYILPLIKLRYEADGVRDLPARREAWNDYTDDLCKSGQISERQYNNWSQPAICN